MKPLLLDLFSHPPAQYLGGAITIGNFDGVHLGHRALIQAVQTVARQIHGPALAVTFDPPPLALLNPQAVKPSLTTWEQRVEFLMQAGADAVLTLRTEAGLLSLSAESFFEDVILGQLRAQAVVEGFNFRFGRQRTGDVALLRQFCALAGRTFLEVPPHLVNGEAISSSRIRTALHRGDVELAAQLLGRAYQLSGTVETGAQRGRTLGFPTANIGCVQTLVPKPGVYAVRCIVNGAVHAGAANLGANPTFQDQTRKIEVHLLDFNGDMYGLQVTVEFVARLRDTVPFTGIEQLKAQLVQDVARTRACVRIPLS